jgi:hypothetical protein
MISFSRGAQKAKHRAVQGGSLAGGRGRRICGEIRRPTRRREIWLGVLLPAFGPRRIA